METFDLEDEIVKLAGLPNGNHKPRRVASIEGQHFYGQPIGSIIMPDVVDKKISDAAKIGITPPKGALSGGGDHESGSGSSGGSSAVLAPAKPKIKIAKSTISGNKHFSVGNAQYSAPAGSKLIHSVHTPGIAYVVTPDSKVHVFNEAGEAQLDTATSKALANKFLSGNLGDAYEQVDFDSTSASYSIDQLKTGSKLTDQRGNVQFEKTGDDEWTQPLLGAKLTTEDLQPMYDSGELIPEATPEHDAQQQAFETGNKKNFADMDKSEFVDALAAYPEGQQLNFGPDSATVTKTGDDVWELDDGHTTVSSGDLYYSKGTIDTGESEHTDEPSSAPEASAPASPEPPEPAVKKEPRHKAEDTPANAAVSFEQSDLEAAGPGTKIDIDIPGDDTFVLEMNDDHEWVDVTYPANKYTNEDVAADIAEGNVYFSKSKRSLTKDTAKAKPKVEEPKTPEPKLPEDPTELPNGVPLGAVRASEDDLKAAPVGTHMWIYHEGYSGASGEFHKTEQGWNGYGVPIPDSVMYDGNEKNTFYAAYPEGVHAEPAVSEDVTGDQPGQNPSKEWISAAPVGSQLVYDDPKGPGSWDKQSNGEWLNNHSGNVFDNEDMYDLIYDHGNTDIVIGQEAKTTELPPSPDISVQPDGSHSVGDTISGVDDLNQLEAGTKLDYLLPDGSMASYAKLNSGDWLTPNGKVLPSTKLKTTANSGKMTVASLPEKAIDTPTDGITFDNSGKSFTEHDVQEALDSLKNHSSFQIAYGLKAVPDNPIAKVGSDDLKLWAANAYPDLKPKAGLIQLFEDKLGGKPEVPEAAPDKSAEPQISIGALTGKKGTNGAVGGTYALSDVQEAVDILEGFDGKVFKNALTQKNNPLAELSPNDIVGFDKDKLVTKQKFIDLLKKKISEADLPKVENPDIDYDKFTKLGPGSTLIFHGIVGDKTYTKQDDGIWITDGTSSALTDQNWQPSIAKGKVEITKAVPAKKSVGDLLADVAAEQFEASQKSKTEWAAKLNEIYDIKTQTPPGGEYSVNSVNELDALAPGTKIFATDSEGDQDYYTAAGDGVWSDDSFNDKFTSSYFTEPLSQDNVFVYGVPVDKSEADLPELTPEWLSTAPLGSEVTYTNANGKSTVYHKVSDETWATANDPGVTIKEDIISKVSSNPKTSHMLTVNKVGDGTSKANSDHIISNSEADGLPTGTKIRNTLNGDIYERSSDTEWKRTEGSGPETISHDHVRQGAVNKAWALDSKPENKTDTTPNTPDEPNTPEEESTPQEDVTSAPATEADVTSAKPGDFFVSSSGGLAYVKQNNGTWNVYDVQSGQVQPKLYSDDSLKVLVSNGHTNKLEPSEPNDSGLVPGKYWTGGGKAYMIVKPDGTGIYVNSKNVASNLTVAKVKSNHKAGMNVYGGQVKDLPEVPKKQPAVKKFKSVSTIDDGTYYNGDPSDNKTWSYEVHGDTTTVIKPKVDSNYKIGSKPTKEWMAQASAGASFEYKYDVNSVYTKSADGKWLDKDGDEASENIIDNATYYYSYYKVKSNGKSAPVEMPTKKVNTAFETGKLLDEWGNSVVPDDYTGLVSFFGAKSQISDLAKIDELIDDMPAEINFDTYLKNHGVMFLGSKVKAYAAAEGLESNLDSWEKVLKEKAKEMLAGLDTTPPESHAADLFTWNGMGEANYPTNLAGVGQSAYNVSDYNNAIKAISANFGNGKIIGQHYTKMDIYGKKAWVKAFNDGDFAKMYMLEDEAAKKTNSAHVSGIQHPGNPANEGTNHIVWTAAVPGEVSALKTVEGDWSSFNTEASIDEINNYLIKAQMQNPTYLSNSERRIWVNYHRHQNKQLTDQLSLVALNRKKSGDTPLSDPVEWTDNVQPAKIYDTLFENAEFPQSWPQSKAEAYYDDNLDAIPELKSLYDTSESEHPYSGEYLWKTQAVTNYFQQKQEEADAKALIPVYTLKPNQTVKQGTHPHYQFTDQWGGEYGFKFVNPSGNTKLDRYRAEAEHHALLLARTFGYNGAQSHTIDLDTPLGKKYGILQKWHDATGDLMGADWSTMTPTIVGDVASEHVLDWLLDNDDTKGDNMLITPAGRAVGIDKGRAFKHYGAWNGLSGDSSMDSNAQTVYRKMFDAIRSGKIDKETADKAYFQMQKRIKLIQAQSEDVVKGLIADGMKNRDHFDIDYKIDGKKVPANLVGLQNALPGPAREAEY